METKIKPVRRFNIFTWRNLGRLMLGIATLVTLIALIFAEEDWRGKHAWEKYRREAEAHGAIFDSGKFIPPLVPDDQNFAMTPFLAPFFDLNPKPLKPGQSSYRDTNGFNRTQNFATNSNWIGTYTSKNKPATVIESGHLADFDEMAAALWKKNNLTGPVPTGVAAVKAVLANVSQYGEVFDELEQASHRSYARFNIPYDDENPAGILLPHLGRIKRFVQLVQIHALAELALGHPAAALEKYKFMAYLTETIREEPILISQLVRFAAESMDRKVVWEGLAREQWDDQQLQAIQASLNGIDFMKSIQRSVLGERTAFGNKLFDYMRKHQEILSEALDDGGTAGSMFRFAPSGWLYLEQRSYNRMFEERLLAGFNEKENRVIPSVIDKNVFTNDVDQIGVSRLSVSRPVKHFFKHDLLATLLLPSLANAYRKATISQVGVDETMTACALERFRLARKNLPESLTELVPQYLDQVPQDICSGNPLIYKRLSGREFLLYSVGWNQTDDGGVTATNVSGALDLKNGDWVWPAYPSK